MNTPVTVMDTAGEGGAWGIALLAAYMKEKEEKESLQDYLKNKIFAGQESSRLAPETSDVAGYEKFMERYMAGLAVERAAVDNL